MDKNEIINALEAKKTEISDELNRTKVYTKQCFLQGKLVATNHALDLVRSYVQTATCASKSIDEKPVSKKPKKTAKLTNKKNKHKETS